jgi:cobalt-precorrin 5A hydrolase
MIRNSRMATEPYDIAVWVLTPNGLDLAQRLSRYRSGLHLHCPLRLAGVCPHMTVRPFERLIDAVAEHFNLYSGHIFIMATGIVVRGIAPLLRHKSVDPAVVVDDAGRFAISLVAGHIGGDNRLAKDVAERLDAVAVITTATDSHGRPAVDALAMEAGLTIENPDAIKAINMALLAGEPVALHDPDAWLAEALGASALPIAYGTKGWPERIPQGIFVDDRCTALPSALLVLRPPSLVAGIGCNRNTHAEEIAGLLHDVLSAHRLSPLSLAAIASVDLKQDEGGLLSLATTLALPLVFYSRESLNQVRHVPHPSPMAVKHIGVQSVCEAAALLSAGNGTLIVPKQKSANVTVAIARRPSSWSAPVPATSIIFPSVRGKCWPSPTPLSGMAPTST